MQKTRRQILDILKRRCTGTLDELAREVGLSAVTIRAHISVLEREGLVTSDEVRGRIGRPHFVYALAERAENEFPTAYDTVAHRFLEGLKAIAGAEQMGKLVEHVAEQWASEHGARMSGKDLRARVEEATKVRSEEGAMADWEQHNGSFTIRQHNCPALRIAKRHPEVCRAELEYLRRLIGATVERETAIRTGETVCAYRVTA